MPELALRIGIAGRAPEKLAAIVRRLRPALSGAFRELLNEIQSRATKLAPIRTGHLRRTIGPPRITELPLGIMGTLTATASYAAAVEFGTRPHAIRPRRAKALRFLGRGGQVVFARSVQHPGTRPKPYLQPAFDQVKSHARERIAAIIEQTIREA